ncbi:MAG: hydrogenase iron-sulfur subunit [Chloroflexota bacterium]
MSEVPLDEFTPNVLAFCCLYCAYAAADVAGSLRLGYPESVRVVRVPCAGRVEPLHILKAFESGVDGVLVIGCLDGQCHFREGNQKAQLTVRRMRTLLADLGLGEDRLEFHNVGAAMGQQFADIVTGAVNRLQRLGPSPVSAQAGRHVAHKAAVGDPSLSG